MYHDIVENIKLAQMCYGTVVLKINNHANVFRETACGILENDIVFGATVSVVCIWSRKSLHLERLALL